MSRAWVFTLNNYSDIEYQVITETDCDYLVIGKEVGENGTPHLQGYLYKQSKMSQKQLKKIMPRAHLEVAGGTPKQNYEYCTKEGNFEEFGTMPRQGKRTDIEDVKDTLKTTGRIQDVIEKCTNLQQLKFAETAVKYLEKKRNFKPEVIWLYGQSGSGKTRTAYEMMPDCYRKTNSSGQWWDGYDAHPDVLIDDFKDGTLTYSSLLELLDRYECRVQYKGGSRQFLARRIVITSIHPPDHWFPDHVELYRRIDEIRLIH